MLIVLVLNAALFVILGVGGPVMGLNRPWPDLVVGVIVAVVPIKGGRDILREAVRVRDVKTTV